MVLGSSINRNKLYSLTLFCVFLSLRIHANIVANGGFEAGTTNWNNVAYDGGSCNYSIINTDAPEGNNYLEADVTALGSNSWSVQSIHSGFSTPLVVGEKYTLSFYAKSDVIDNEFQVVLQGGGTWQLAFKRAVSANWTKYTVHFDAQYENPSFKFEFQKTGTYSIDDVRVVAYTGINDPISVNLNPDNTFQIMEGFGGAATWFIYRLDNSADRNFILDKFINDVGIDLLRVKNWYYPLNYPSDKSTTSMVDWNEQVSYQPTIDLVNDIRALNPDVKVLLSSWGPPKSLKSNNSPKGGTLSKLDGSFEYGKLADYYVDMLDNIGFEPDWVSFQNEPGYIDDWRTCQWRPTETAEYPGLDQALDSIYEKIKDRPFLPKILAPEVENIGNVSWAPSKTTYSAFTEAIKDKPYVDFYAFHNYNFGDPTSINNPYFFNVVRDEFPEHPSIMTEYSGKEHSWLEAATLIQNTMVEAGASGYIWWSLIWNTGSKAMIQFDESLNWEYAKEYHLIKHFAKFVDAGYTRVELTGNNDTYKGSAYINPSEDEITLVLVNNNKEQEVEFSLDDEWTILGETAYQSTNSTNFVNVSTDIENGIILPDSSLTTIVLSVDKILSNSEETQNDTFKIFPNPTDGLINLSAKVEYEVLNVLGEVILHGNNNSIDITNLSNGTYYVRVKNQNYPIQKIGK